VKLEKAIEEAIQQAPPEIRAVIEALQALRGVAQTTAATIVFEVGPLSRFPIAPQLMEYRGLVAIEHTTGNRVQRGGLTKTGKSPQAGCGRGRLGQTNTGRTSSDICSANKGLAISDEVKDTAWKAQQRFEAMDARGKNKNQIVAALGRELLRFVWALGVKTERQHKLGKAA